MTTYKKSSYDGVLSLLISEKALIMASLRKHSKRYEQAHALGISERTLINKIRKHNLI